MNGLHFHAAHFFFPNLCKIIWRLEIKYYIKNNINPTVQVLSQHGGWFIYTKKKDTYFHKQVPLT